MTGAAEMATITISCIGKMEDDKRRLSTRRAQRDNSTNKVRTVRVVRRRP